MYQTLNVPKKIAGCIIIENNQILLLKKKTKSWWEIPGGTIEPGESPEQTAIREMKEEICCDVEILPLFQEKEFEHKGKRYHGTWFFAKRKQDQHPKIGEPGEYTQLAFIPLEDLTILPISPNVEELLASLEISRA